MKNFRPTTPSRRHMTTVDYSVLTDVRRYKPLTHGMGKRGGRNNQGRITMRHQGGGNKRV